MNTLHLIIALSLVTVLVATAQLIAAARNRPVAPVEYATFADSIPTTFVDRGALTAAIENPSGATPLEYVAENRHEYPVPFDTNHSWLTVAAETRVWPRGASEQVLVFGDVDLELSDAPHLAAAVLDVYFAAEGLTTDSRVRIAASPATDSIVLTTGLVTVHLQPDDAFALVDDLRAALRALAEGASDE